MNYIPMAQSKKTVPIGVTRGAESSVQEFRPKGQLEKEDIVILVLSVVLIIATMWLASAVL